MAGEGLARVYFAFAYTVAIFVLQMWIGETENWKTIDKRARKSCIQKKE